LHISHLINKHLLIQPLQAWEQWQYWYQDYVRQQRLIKGGLNRMRHLQLSRAWERWQAHRATLYYLFFYCALSTDVGHPALRLDSDLEYDSDQLICL